jgi:hypothetical protein
MPTPAIVIQLASRLKGALRSKKSAPVLLLTTNNLDSGSRVIPYEVPTVIDVQTSPVNTVNKPLRVVHVAEGAGIGRLRISGRMADVCAELDRLAALEAA